MNKFLFGLPSVDGKYDCLVMNSVLNQHAYIIEGHHQMVNDMRVHTLIHNARNEIALDAATGIHTDTYDLEFDYLFFIDDDVVIPKDALKKLVAHDKDIVAGMYFGRGAPFAPVIYKKGSRDLYDNVTEYPKNKLIEVDGIGMGCCLIKTSVLKNFIHKTQRDHPDGSTENVTECYAFEPIPAEGKRPAINGEDLAFCKRAQDKGYKIYVDTGIQCKHVTTRYIDEDYFEKSKQRMKAQEAF